MECKKVQYSDPLSIFNADLFSIVTNIDIASSADNNTLFGLENTVYDLIESFQQTSNDFKKISLSGSADEYGKLASTNDCIGIENGGFQK